MLASFAAAGSIGPAATFRAAALTIIIAVITTHIITATCAAVIRRVRPVPESAAPARGVAERSRVADVAICCCASGATWEILGRGGCGCASEAASRLELTSAPPRVP